MLTVQRHKAKQEQADRAEHQKNMSLVHRIAGCG